MTYTHAVDTWLANVDEATGGTADPALVRLGLAVMSGLLLDLVATEDQLGVDASVQAFVDLIRRAPRSPRQRVLASDQPSSFRTAALSAENTSSAGRADGPDLDLRRGVPSPLIP